MSSQSSHGGWLEWLEGRGEGAGGTAATLERRARLERGERIVDLGAGTGLLALTAAKAVGISGTVFAVDSEPDCLERLNEKARSKGFSNIRTIHADIRNVPLESGSIDVALARSALIYTGDARACAREIERLVTEGGRFSVCEPLLAELTWWGAPPDLVEELNRAESIMREGRAGVSLDREDLREAFDSANLSFSSLVVTYRLDFSGRDVEDIVKDYLFDLPGELSAHRTLRDKGGLADDYVTALAGQLAGASSSGSVKGSLPCIFIWGSRLES